jgi:mono/diheme cytochrome c family protein
MKKGRGRALPVAIVMTAVAWALPLLASGVLAREADKVHDKPAHSALATVPDKARAMHNPLEGERDAVAAGGKLFEQHCAECHGKKAEGSRRGPNLLRQQVQQATPGAIYWVITNGVVRRGMPVWSKLPEPERWQIVTFLKSLKDGQNHREEGK